MSLGIGPDSIWQMWQSEWFHATVKVTQSGEAAQGGCKQKRHHHHTMYIYNYIHTDIYSVYIYTIRMSNNYYNTLCTYIYIHISSSSSSSSNVCVYIYIPYWEHSLDSSDENSQALGSPAKWLPGKYIAKLIYNRLVLVGVWLVYGWFMVGLWYLSLYIYVDIYLRVTLL